MSQTYRIKEITDIFLFHNLLLMEAKNRSPEKPAEFWHLLKELESTDRLL